MHTLGRFAAVSLFWISTGGCTLNYIAAPPPDLSQARLIFSDEFNGTSLDTTKWNATSYNSDALNAFNPAMVSVSGGNLVLQMEHIPWLGQEYSGGQVDTDHKFTVTYGYLEARLKPPKGSGFHASWWLWPDDNIWPPELDIVEFRGYLPGNANTGQLWFDSTQPNNLDGAAMHCNYDIADFTTDFHTFGLFWSSEVLIWYIDGIERCRSTTDIPTKAFRLQLDLALGGPGGPVDETTILPATYLVDYVRVYRFADDQPPGSPGEKENER